MRRLQFDPEIEPCDPEHPPEMRPVAEFEAQRQTEIEPACDPEHLPELLPVAKSQAAALPSDPNPQCQLKSESESEPGRTVVKANAAKDNGLQLSDAAARKKIRKKMTRRLIGEFWLIALSFPIGVTWEEVIVILVEVKVPEESQWWVTLCFSGGITLLLGSIFLQCQERGTILKDDVDGHGKGHQEGQDAM
ncbi:hypothetical protein CYMTET_15855 [Cymbomonas tetramitiformis]|uniref:Uncharacterized protein n=1 Tax=Cymbomonas tetramitiformis TaxID=36881 RepID=A0AAE0L8X3_9CHLO|nr:hypothetical protein CYMTET_15855 [Cymbomonas tetramitiformis]